MVIGSHFCLAAPAPSDKFSARLGGLERGVRGFGPLVNMLDEALACNLLATLCFVNRLDIEVSALSSHIILGWLKVQHLVVNCLLIALSFC